jgi:hypothetical protein
VAAYIYGGDIKNFYKWIEKIAIKDSAFYDTTRGILSVPLKRKGLEGNIPLLVVGKNHRGTICTYTAEEIRFKIAADNSIVTMFPSLWSPYYNKWLIKCDYCEIKNNPYCNMNSLEAPEDETLTVH